MDGQLADLVRQRIVRLFNPRTDPWSEHFVWQKAVLFGKTDIGRATIQALKMNRTDGVAVRELLMMERVYPMET